MTVLSTGVLRNLTLVILILSTVPLLMYFKSSPLPKCHPSPVEWSETEKSGNASAKTRRKKPVLLVWFWPENKKFDLQDCKTLLGIGDCQLSDDKLLASEVDGVLIYHKAISQDLSNLPTSRTRTQRWIWFNPDPPLVSQQIPGIQALFNLTMTYRKDADIQVRWKVSARKTPEKGFTPLPKRRLVCWIVDSKEMTNTFSQTYNAYMDLLKHIAVDLIDKMEGEDYLSTIKSCKFYLSFESSIHRDYITEKFTTPLALGTVPVALGPPRRNYESFVPGSSFIHVNDFADSAALAAHLQSLDQDEEAYLRYFDWRKFYTIGTPFADEKYRFLHPICQACHHLSVSRVFRYVPDLYKWFLVATVPMEGFKKGFYAERNAIIVFSACFLPDSNCDNYSYVMENLFLLKKHLKMFIIVHPSWFIRTLLGITRPFISTKFSSRIKYVNRLQELGRIIPMEYVNIPASIIRVDKKKTWDL